MVVGSSKGLSHHDRQKTPHPASSLSHLLPSEKEKHRLRRDRRSLLSASSRAEGNFALRRGEGGPQGGG